MLIGAGDEDTHIRIRPYSSTYYMKKMGKAYKERPMIKLKIPKGGAVLFRGDIFHGGGRFKKENRRAHLYFWMKKWRYSRKPKDNTFPKHSLASTKREHQAECGDSDDEYN